MRRDPLVRTIRVDSAERPDYIPHPQNNLVDYDTGVQFSRSKRNGMPFKTWLFLLIIVLVVIALITRFLRNQYEENDGFRMVVNLLMCATGLMALWNKAHLVGFLRVPGDVPLYHQALAQIRVIEQRAGIDCPALPASVPTSTASASQAPNNITH